MKQQKILTIILCLLSCLLIVAPASALTWTSSGTGYWYSVSGSTTYIMVNTSTTTTWTMPTGLVSNTLSNIVLVGNGGAGGIGTNGGNSVTTNTGPGGYGGGAGSAGSITTQPSYVATGGAPYALIVGAPTTAFGYSATAGTTGATGYRNSSYYNVVAVGV